MTDIPKFDELTKEPVSKTPRPNGGSLGWRQRERGLADDKQVSKNASVRDRRKKSNVGECLTNADPWWLAEQDLVKDSDRARDRPWVVDKALDASKEFVARTAAKEFTKGVQLAETWLPTDPVHNLGRMGNEIEPAATGLAETGAHAVVEEIAPMIVGIPPFVSQIVEKILAFSAEKKFRTYAEPVEQWLWQADVITSISPADLWKSQSFRELVNPKMEDALKGCIKAHLDKVEDTLSAKVDTIIGGKQVTRDTRMEVAVEVDEGRNGGSAGLVLDCSADRAGEHLTARKSVSVQPKNPGPFAERLRDRRLVHLVAENVANKSEATRTPHTQPMPHSELVGTHRTVRHFKSSTSSSGAPDPIDPDDPPQKDFILRYKFPTCKNKE